MAEFDPFAFLGWFVPMVLSSAFGAFVYMTRSSWSRGNKEAKTEGEAELNQTMVTNAIREIENLKTDLKNLVVELQTHKINITRVEERIKYMAEMLDIIRVDIKNIGSQIQNSDDKQTARDRNSNDRYYRQESRHRQQNKDQNNNTIDDENRRYQ